MNNQSKPNRSRPAQPARKRVNPKGRGPQGPVNPQQIFAPAAMGRRMGSTAPQERILRNGRSIRFKEYVQDIAGVVAFGATSFPVQPGISTLFAWLASQAVSYQEYRFRSLRFLFETEKASSASGKVMLAFQPDAADSVPASKQELLENQFKASSPVWAPCAFNVPVSEALGAKRYIRSGVLAANLDIKTYDLGNLIVAAQGCADTSAIGELYVEYEIELSVPVVSASAQAKAQSGYITAGGTISKTALFGTAAVVSGGLDVTASGNVLTFNRVGSYIVSLLVTGTGLFTAFAPTLTAPAAGSSAALLGGISNAAANAGTNATASYTVVVVTRGTTLTIDCNAVSTTVTACVAACCPWSTA